MLEFTNKDIKKRETFSKSAVVYLDNAATSFPKPKKVIEEMARFMEEYCANPGRSGHFMAVKTSSKVMEVRERICEFFNLKSPFQVCFTKNATEALNIAIRGLLKPGDHVITTSMEHNSVIRPLKTLERDIGIEITILKGGKYGEINANILENVIKLNTKLVAVTLSSNVNGTILPIKELGKIARKHNKVYLVDASQGAGILPVDMEEMNIDLLAFPGHKGLLGPQGTGALCVGNNIRLEPLMQGGTGSKSNCLYQPDIMPDLLESGTLNTPGIIGLGCGLDFINCCGIDNLKFYKDELLKRLHGGLSDIEGIVLYSKDTGNSGIVAMNINGVDSTETSYILNKDYNIATRAGLHCAPLAHETLGTKESGVVRLSLGCFNTVSEIDYVVSAIKKVADVIS